MSEDRLRENELLEKELDKIEQREKHLLSKRKIQEDPSFPVN